MAAVDETFSTLVRIVLSISSKVDTDRPTSITWHAHFFWLVGHLRKTRLKITSDVTIRLYPITHDSRTLTLFFWQQQNLHLSSYFHHNLHPGLWKQILWEITDCYIWGAGPFSELGAADISSTFWRNINKETRQGHSKRQSDLCCCSCIDRNVIK